jgi:hypothetical protein
MPRFSRRFSWGLPDSILDNAIKELHAPADAGARYTLMAMSNATLCAASPYDFAVTYTHRCDKVTDGFSSTGPRESNPPPFAIRYGENGPSGFGRIPLVSRSGTVAEVPYHAWRRIRNPTTVLPIMRRIRDVGSGTGEPAAAPVLGVVCP